MRKIGNADGWAGMFSLTEFAENAVILILLTLIPLLSPVHWSRAHWTPLRNVFTVFVVECQHRTKEGKYYLVTKAIVATF